MRIRIRHFFKLRIRFQILMWIRIRIQLQIQGFDDQKFVINSQLEIFLYFFDQKVQFTYPKASLKEAQATGKAFNPRKRTSSTSKHEYSFRFYISVNFALLDPDPATQINADPMRIYSPAIKLFLDPGPEHVSVAGAAGGGGRAPAPQNAAYSQDQGQGGQRATRARRPAAPSPAPHPAGAPAHALRSRTVARYRRIHSN
jgi:hypothetical protein